MEITIATPRSFNFKRSIISHGWCDLPPFELDEANWTLRRVIDLPRRPVTITMRAARRAVVVETSERLSARDSERVARDVRHMLRLDDDMREFYKAVAHDEDFKWVASSGAGRLLRSPTVFEDLVKTICTTNCSWALTKKMVSAMVENLGQPTRDGRRAFPTAEALAAQSESFYREEVRAGYRAPYFKELAEAVASGQLDVESWLTSDLSTDALKRAMKRVKGVGDYAAENLLKLVGRYDCLALDSWVRAKFARSRNGDRAATDREIGEYYARFGAWRGLALWCDMTKDWIDEKGAAAW